VEPNAERAVAKISGRVIAEQRLGNGLSLWTIRLSFDPGAGLPFSTRNGATVVSIEEGTIGFTAVSGRATIGEEADRVASIGVEYFLGRQRTISFGPNVMHCLRNADNGATSLLITTVAPLELQPYARATSTEGVPVQFPNAGNPTR
jgi:hypothetical protein